MPVAIECRDLRKTYDGKVEAVRGLNLEIQVGECFGLLGPNGAGKTTTIEILEGLLAADFRAGLDLRTFAGTRTSARCASGLESRCRRRASRRS